MTQEPSSGVSSDGGKRRKPLPKATTSGLGDISKDELAGAPDVGLLQQFWRFRDYGKGELRPLSFGVVMRFAELASDMAAPWPMALAIDTVLRGQQPHGFIRPIAHLFGHSAMAVLLVAAVAVLLITALSGVFDYLGDRLMNSSGERITTAIRRDVFAHMQRLPMSFHDKTAVGELTSRISTDTGRIEDGMVGVFATLIPGVLSLIGYTAVLLYVDWRLGIIALLAAPLLFVTASKYTRLTRKSTRARRAAEGKLSGFVAESLQGVRTIHAFGRQDLHNSRFKEGNDKVLSTGLRAVELRARFTPLLEAVAAVGTATLLFVGGYGVLQHWWTVGVLVVVTGYLRDMLKPMRGLSKLALTFTQGAASAERIAVIFDHHPPEATITSGLPERIFGDIRLDDVVLDYGRGPVLNHLNLNILPGERIGLLGHNGAGKSTLLSLISGLYQPTSGHVLVDGIPLSEVPDDWRHRQIAVVLQDTFLFSGTIRDNIRYGRPDAPDEEVEYAAKAALVTEFTKEFGQGLDAELTDGGIGLSGGQRQRVGIARALLTNAPVVLLDEPTTGLDVHAEELVVRALSELVTGRTVIMTTHRPAVLRLATRTIELRQGTVVQAARRSGTEPVHRPDTDPARLPGGEPVRRLGPAPTGGALEHRGRPRGRIGNFEHLTARMRPPQPDRGRVRHEPHPRRPSNYT
jgi:ABC-type multidrug transport system fused ATPase/permease subunit